MEIHRSWIKHIALRLAFKNILLDLYVYIHIYVCI